MKWILGLSRKYRILITRILGILAALLILFSAHRWHPGPLQQMGLELIAFVLVLAATFGRIWTLSYISGHKKKDLITEGPYSMMRNPLYFFSFIGVIGLGIATLSILLLTVLLITFALYYPLVIWHEEGQLTEVHGEAYRNYRREVPSFLPKPSLYREPAEYPVNARMFRKAFLSVMWFPLIFLFLLFLNHLHSLAIWPVLFIIP